MSEGFFLFVMVLLQILYIIYVYVKSNRNAGYSDINDYSSDNYHNNDDYSSDNSYHQDDYNWISDVGFSHCDGNIYHIPND